MCTARGALAEEFMTKPTHSRDLEPLLEYVRRELARAGAIEGLERLLRAVERRLYELVHEEEAHAQRLEVSVHVGGSAVAVEIQGGPSRDWFQLW